MVYHVTVDSLTGFRKARVATHHAGHRHAVPDASVVLALLGSRTLFCTLPHLLCHVVGVYLTHSVIGSLLQRHLCVLIVLAVYPALLQRCCNGIAGSGIVHVLELPRRRVVLYALVRSKRLTTLADILHPPREVLHALLCRRLHLHLLRKAFRT